MKIRQREMNRTLKRHSNSSFSKHLIQYTESRGVCGVCGWSSTTQVCMIHKARIYYQSSPCMFIMNLHAMHMFVLAGEAVHRHNVSECTHQCWRWQAECAALAHLQCTHAHLQCTHAHLQCTLLVRHGELDHLCAQAPQKSQLRRCR